ncbi:hypothetical protein F5Y17DRAFT_445920 [Xylariaceae sp. FL0594]|nr:hypothetical protein F5Y17DRAFT_445920 [Xylariaceae sp. FL0594]
MGIASGIGHLVESIVEMIQGVFTAILHIVSLAFNTVFGIFEGAFNFVLSLFSGFVNFVEGTLGFAIHNFFILGTAAAVVLGYMYYTQKKGTAPASRTIKN